MSRAHSLVALPLTLGALYSGACDPESHPPADPFAEPEADECDAGEESTQGGEDDVCVVTPLPLGEIVTGDTFFGADSRSAACGGSSAQRDATYAIPHDAGLLTVAVASAHDAVLELRSDCFRARPELCSDVEFEDGIEVVSACVEAGMTFAIVDGNGDAGIEHEFSAGPFSIRATLDPCATGCRADLGACVSEADPGDDCADAAPLALDSTVVTSLAALGDDLSGLACPTPGPGLPDGVFEVQLPTAGELSVRAWDPDFQILPQVAIRPDCADRASEVACSALGSTRACLEPGPYALIVEAEDERELALSTSFRACAGTETCQWGYCLPPLAAEIEPNDDPETAMVVGDGAWVEASFDPSSEIDYYRVTLEPGQTVTASTTRGCDADTVVLLAHGARRPAPTVDSCDDVSPDTQLDCSDDAENTLCSVTSASLPEGGDVFIRVNRHALERDMTEPGRYVLDVEIE
ncbi:MAG: hypothetical protein HYY06_31245 [Deltaproteobacteria bacterium]|nr:hypothetical protein [Deltaproteobacteria bacterium]